MLNTTTLIIEAVARRLVTEYRRVFGRREPDSLRKQTALFYGLLEIGLAPRLGYACPADLGDGYAGCFWVKVEPQIGDALRYLMLTQEGRQWIANLYAQVFAVEHRRWRMGPHPGIAMEPAPPA